MERTVILVQFDGTSKDYAYFTDSPEISKGDHVVVKIRSIFRVACVTKTRGLTAVQISKASAWIVQKVDVTEYEAKVKREEVIQEIKNKLHQRKNEMQEMLMYQQLAQADPAIGALLTELKNLEPTLVPQLTDKWKDVKWPSN